MTDDEQDFEAAFDEAAKKKPEPKKAAPAAADEGEGEGQQADPVVAVQGDEPKQADEDTVDSLREQLKELSHQERSSASRVSVFMREANQLRDQVADLRAQVASLQADLAKAKTGKPTPAPDDGDADDMLDGAPDLKAAVERRIQKSHSELRSELDAAKTQLAEVGQTVSQAAQKIEPLASREEQREVELVRGQLDKVFPAWRADIASGAVKAWLEGQPEQIKSMFPGKGLADSSTVLKLFYADKGAQKEDPKPGQVAASSERLRQAAGIAPRTATRLAPNKDDFDGAFAEFAAKRKN